jgi:hypothetical protein
MTRNTLKLAAVTLAAATTGYGTGILIATTAIPLWAGVALLTTTLAALPLTALL